MRRAPLFLCCCITMVSSRYFINVNPYYYKQLSKDGSVPESRIRLPHAGISSIFGNIRNPSMSKSRGTNRFPARHPFLRHNLSLLYLAPSMINPTAINPVMPVRQPMAARFQSFRARKNISVKPTITAITKNDTVPLPVIGFQSNLWVWPKGDVTGPLLGVPVKSVQQLPDKGFL